DTSGIDLVSDISSIPAPDGSFDAILCSEVIEHIPAPLAALAEFRRLLAPGGRLILTAPFASLVHFAPYHFSSGFSRYWYELHLPKHGFEIDELTANGDWFDMLRQELMRWWKVSKSSGSLLWPVALVAGYSCALLLRLPHRKKPSELSCFGWHCIATKQADST
ncbi:MAG: class I SAM-dependent methyltransferase, partial [Planctomycetales bacterium]|nr:class I SAM-dependent methyltransferase [Planctomycetales bacterium]